MTTLHETMINAFDALDNIFFSHSFDSLQKATGLESSYLTTVLQKNTKLLNISGAGIYLKDISIIEADAFNTGFLIERTMVNQNNTEDMVYFQLAANSPANAGFDTLVESTYPYTDFDMSVSGPAVFLMSPFSYSQSLLDRADLVLELALEAGLIYRDPNAVVHYRFVA